MANVTEVGSPGFASSGSEAAGTDTLASVWGTGQTQAAGDYLVALVIAGGNTSVGAISETTGTWTLLDSVTTTRFSAAAFGKVAVGGDAAPTFSAVFSGTTARALFCAETHQFTGQDTTTPVPAHGNNSGTSGTSVAVTTGQVVPVAGCIGLSVAGEYYTTSSTKTVTVSSGWALTDNWNSGAGGYGHAGWATDTSPAAGSALTCTTSWGTGTTSNFGGVVVVIQPAQPVAKTGSDTAAGTDSPAVHASPASGDGAKAKEAAYNFGGDWGKAAESASVQQGGSSPSSADTGHATSSASVQVTLTGTDSGHAAEAASVHVTVSGADAAQGLQAGSSHATLAQGDTGHGGEAGSVRAMLAGAESGHGAESGSVHFSLSAADSGHGAEAGSVHGTLAKGDTGHAADAGSVPGSPVGLDSGHGAEAASVHASLAKTDTAHAAEAGPAPGSPAGADSGHGSEAASVHASLAGAQGIHGAESSSSHATLSSPDTAHAAEAGSRSGNPVGAESGHGAEAGSVHASLAKTDTSHGAEASSLTENLPGADSAHAADTGSVHVTLSSPDSAAAAEHGQSSGGITNVTSADAGLGTESAFYYISSAEAGHGSEGGLAIRIAAKDTAGSSDRPLNAWPARADSAKAADRPLSGWPAGDDTAHGAEGHGPFRFARADSASALEVLHEMGIWTYIPVGVRLLGRFWRVSVVGADGTEEVIFEGERLTGDMLDLAERVNGPRVPPPSWLPLESPGAPEPAPAPGAPVPWSRGARTVRRVTSGDLAAAREASRPVVGVTCWAVPAVRVTVQVLEVAAVPS